MLFLILKYFIFFCKIIWQFILENEDKFFGKTFTVILTKQRDGAGAERIELEDGKTDEEKAVVLYSIFLDVVVAATGIGPRRGCSAAMTSTSAAFPCSVRRRQLLSSRIATS